MIKYIVPKKPKILFVGINPHYGSYKNGVPFSNNKNFWYLLNKAGLIKEDMSVLKDIRSLRRFYLRKFGTVYNYGFVNLVDRPTRSVAELAHGEELANNKTIRNIIHNRKPGLVCFIGKITYQKFAGVKNIVTGPMKQDVEGCRAFVASFPIRGPNSTRINEFRLVRKIAFEENARRKHKKRGF